MLTRLLNATLAMGLVFVLMGCATPFAEQPLPLAIKAQRDAHSALHIQQLARDGDWLVIRGYHTTDNWVATLTNTPFSHVGIVDKTNNQVIEAEAKGIHITALTAFIEKSHRLMLVRPVWSNAVTAITAIGKARSLVGKKYDFLGLIGLNVPDRYYCSELALAIYQPSISASEHIPRPIQPGQLYFYGQVLYDAGAVPASTVGTPLVSSLLPLRPSVFLQHRVLLPLPPL